MSHRDFAGVFIIYSSACLLGGTMFGIWQQSLPAGIFVSVALFILGTQLQ